MIVEFVGNRDYDKTLAVATKIARDFKETRFHELARRLLTELPMRRDDFRGLRLPTRAEWEAWRAKHGREDQIRYLCERLRLMNCYQDGQPSDVELFDHQYAEPCGLSTEASQSLFRGKTKVINPLEELLGNPEPVSDDVDEVGEEIKLPPIPGMNLGIRDIPVIAPFLHEDQLILSVEYWREFHPSRTVIGTRELLAWILDVASKRELVDEREWKTLNKKQIAHNIEAMIQWATERADMSETDLLLDALSDLKAGGDRWTRARSAAKELVELGERRAFPLIVHWLKHPETGNYELIRILPLLGQLDAAQAKDHAIAYLDHSELKVSLEAAMIFLKAGDEERALPYIGKSFSKANYSNISADDLEIHVAAVTRLNTPQAWDALALLFDDIGIATLVDFDSVACCRALESHGRPEGLSFYLSLLDNRETGIPLMVGWGRPIAHMFGEKLLDGYVAHDPAAKKILAATKADSEERLAATKAWLDARAGDLKKVGKP